MVCQEFSLRDKVALVAGDSRFWLKHVAVALAEAGADVAVAAKTPKKLEEAAGEVEHLGRRTMTIAVDLTEPSQVQRMVGQTVSGLGKIDVLVNAADLWFTKPFLETTKDEWHEILEVNLTSVFHCCQSVGRQMLKQKRGRIINVTSCLAERGLANGVAYCSAAGGILQLTRALALEWARDSITINAIAAGWFSETDQTAAAQAGPLVRYLPLKRYGLPSEIGSLVVYLASDAAEFITGQFLYVDGALMVRP